MTAAVVPAVKQCRKCREVKSLDEFHNDRMSPDGRHSYCKECARVMTRANQERRRAEMGDEAWREHVRANVQRHRRKTGDVKNQMGNRLRRRAAAEVVANHRSEYDAILARLKYEADKERAS